MMPHIGSIADDIAIVRSMHTDPINHDPAVTFLLTGNQQPGRPTVGSWMAYGLGSVNKNLPEYVVLLSGGGGQPLLARYWGNGFLPSKYQGVQFRSTGDPVLYVSNPEGIDPATRRAIARRRAASSTALQLDAVGDPEIATRIDAYEMAYRMQTSVPELMDISQEPQGGARDVRRRAGQGLVCQQLPAGPPAGRARRAVRATLSSRLGPSRQPAQRAASGSAGCATRPSAALVKDLKQRGLLDETLVIWGGEFGRTAYSQGAISKDSFGRDHHPRCYSIWMAGGGIKPGITLGKTDDFGYNLVEDGVHAHDFQATRAAPAGRRPQAADLPLPGPRLPPDRRQRQRGAQAAGLGRQLSTPQTSASTGVVTPTRSRRGTLDACSGGSRRR